MKKKMNTNEKKEENHRESLKHLRRALYLLGCWNEESSDQTWFRYLLPRCQILRLLYSIVVQCYNVHLSQDDNAAMAEYAIMLVFYIATLVKTYTLFFKRANTAAVLDTLVDCAEKQFKYEGPQIQYLKNANRASEFIRRRLVNFCIPTYIILVIPYSVFEILRRRHFPFRLWFPIDVYESPLFEVYLVSYIALTIVDVWLIVYCDLTFVLLCIQFVAQFQLLRYNLENIHVITNDSLNRALNKTKLEDIPNENCHRPSFHAAPVVNQYVANTQISTNQIIHIQQNEKLTHDLIEDQLYSSNEDNRVSANAGVTNMNNSTTVMVHHENELTAHIEESRRPKNGRRRNMALRIKPTVPLTQTAKLLSSENIKVKRSDRKEENETESAHVRRRDWELLSYRLKFNLEMETQLRGCVQHHMTLLRAIKELQLGFNGMLSFQIIMNILLGIEALYISALTEEVDMKVMLVGAGIMAALSELLVICWTAGRITIESSEIHEALYACDWLDSSERFKSSIRMIMCCCKEPVVIRGAGIVLSRVTFRAICKSGHYCHTLVSNLYHGLKINS